MSPEHINPLSPNRRDTKWRLRLLQAFLLILTLSVALAFYFSTRQLLRDRLAIRMRSVSQISALVLSQLDKQNLQNAANSTAAKKQLQTILLSLHRDIPQAMAVSYLWHSAPDQPWNILTSSGSTPVSILKPLTKEAIIPLAGDRGATLLATSGSLLTAFAPVYGVDNHLQGILAVQVEENLAVPLLQTLALPFFLLFLSALIIAKGARRYSQDDRQEFEKKIDANRKALLELATHQLGVPIATFKWWLEILQDEDSKDLWGNKDVISQVQNGVTRMETIMGALSDANGIRSGDVRARMETLGSMKDLLKRLSDEVLPSLSKHNQKLELHIDQHMQPIQVDAKLILDILREIIDNASVFSPDNTTITLRVSRDVDSAKIEVTDQGYGIPKDDLLHIGEKFTRAGNAAKYKPVGNGLGLFIAKGIIRQLGGELWVDSTQGKGTKVTFTLPFAANPQDSSHAKIYTIK